MGVLTETFSMEMGECDKSVLSDEERAQVNEIVEKIDVMDDKMWQSYVADVQQGFLNFSQSFVGPKRVKEFNEISAVRGKIREIMYRFAHLERKGIFSSYHKGQRKVKTCVKLFEQAKKSLEQIEKDWQFCAQVLTEDIQNYEKKYKQNLQFSKDLTKYVIAGKKALEIAQSTPQNSQNYTDACLRFEKELNDLDKNRQTSVQMASQIRMLQESDQQLVDDMNNIINSTVIWKNRMEEILGPEGTAVQSNSRWIDIEPLKKICGEFEKNFQHGDSKEEMKRI